MSQIGKNTKGSGTPEALRPPLPQIPEPHYWSWGLPADSIFPQRCLPLRPRRVGLWVSWGPPPTFAPRPFHCCASVMDHLPGASSRVRTLCAPGRAGTSRARLPQDPRLTPATPETRPRPAASPRSAHRHETRGGGDEHADHHPLARWDGPSAPADSGLAGTRRQNSGKSRSRRRWAERSGRGRSRGPDSLPPVRR